MGTPSNVSVKMASGKVKTIYGHWDGYPSGVGKTLKEHYNSQERAEQLVNLGNFSSLCESIECPSGHSFNTPADGCTVFYGRDRGEEGQQAYEYNNIEESGEDNSQDYHYYWNGVVWQLVGGGVVTVFDEKEKE